MTIAQALRVEDWPALAELAADRFGVPVDADALERACVGRACSYSRERRFTEGESGLLTWIKLRLEELRLFPAGHRGQPEVDLPVPLHIGFVGVVETEEHLAVLRREDVWEQQATPARSKVFTTPLVPNPIDAVAIRVAPKER